jgi:hypothetical protein
MPTGVRCGWLTARSKDGKRRSSAVSRPGVVDRHITSSLLIAGLGEYFSRLDPQCGPLGLGTRGGRRRRCRRVRLFERSGQRQLLADVRAEGRWIRDQAIGLARGRLRRSTPRSPRDRPRAGTRRGPPCNLAASSVAAPAMPRPGFLAPVVPVAPGGPVAVDAAGPAGAAARQPLRQSSIAVDAPFVTEECVIAVAPRIRIAEHATVHPLYSSSGSVPRHQQR